MNRVQRIDDMRIGPFREAELLLGIQAPVKGLSTTYTDIIGQAVDRDPSSYMDRRRTLVRHAGNITRLLFVDNTRMELPVTSALMRATRLRAANRAENNALLWPVRRRLLLENGVAGVSEARAIAVGIDDRTGNTVQAAVGITGYNAKFLTRRVSVEHRLDSTSPLLTLTAQATTPEGAPGRIETVEAVLATDNRHLVSHNVDAPYSGAYHTSQWLPGFEPRIGYGECDVALSIANFVMANRVELDDPRFTGFVDAGQSSRTRTV